jgi:hypothetical protein
MEIGTLAVKEGIQRKRHEVERKGIRDGYRVKSVTSCT